MRFIYAILCVSFLFVGCQPKVDNSASEAFEKNSKTVLTLLEGFQKESIDYAAIYLDSLFLQTIEIFFSQPDGFVSECL